MSKVIDKAIEEESAVEKPLDVVESLKARIAELEARMEELESGKDGLRYIEFGGKMVCLRGDEPLFIAEKADEDAIAELGVMSDPKTIRSIKQALEILEELRADKAVRTGA